MRKTSVYLVLAVLICMPLLLSGVSTVTAATGDTFIVGATNNPGTFDPAQCYDSVSYDFMMQFLEGLFKPNTSSSDMEPIPCLAADYGTWSLDGLNYTVDLKTGIKFTDGSDFDADAVKWNFDRVLYLFQNEVCEPEILWKVGTDWILDRVEVIDSDTVRFVLNFEAKVWVKVLSTPTCFMISPTLAEGYEESLLELSDVDLIAGTGPWILDSFTLSQRVIYKANTNYHAGAPQIKKMIFQIIKDDTTFSQAVLAHSVHFGGTIPAFWSQVDADPTLSVQVVPTTVGYYLTFNVNQIPRDVRYAIALSINYSYIVNVIRLGRAVQLHTPIFQGIQYHNNSIVGLPTFDPATARQNLLDSTDPIIISALATAGLSGASSANDWVAAAEGSTPLFTYNFTRYTSNTLLNVFNLVRTNLKQIGIKLTDYNIGYFDTWVEFSSDRGNDHRLQLAWGGCAPDYNDPVNIADQIFRTDAPLNTMSLADATLDSMLDDAYTLDDGPERQQLFWDIQEKVAVEICALTMLYQPISRVTWYNKVLSNTDSLFNPFLLLDFYNCVFTPITNDVPGFEIVALMGAIVLGMGLVAKKYYKRK